MQLVSLACPPTDVVSRADDPRGSFVELSVWLVVEAAVVEESYVELVSVSRRAVEARDLVARR